MSKQTFFQNLIKECNMECNTRGEMISDNMGELLAKKFAETFDKFGYPYKSGFNIEWDGNVDGLVGIPFSSNGGFYKVSDIALSYDELIGATLTLSGGEPMLLTSNSVHNGGSVISVGEYIISVHQDNSTLYNITFPVKGTYFCRLNGAYTKQLIKEKINPMAEYFMPVLTSPNGTKYKLTVDDTGTLSATEVTSEEA